VLSGSLAVSLYNLADTLIDHWILHCVPRKVFMLWEAKSLVQWTLRPTDGHSVNRATKPMLLGSRVQARGFMSRSLVVACMHILDISSIA
jgi:hypothetical protein